jgi:hypothetical protein
MIIVNPFTVEKTPLLRDLGFFIVAAFLSASSFGLIFYIFGNVLL